MSRAMKAYKHLNVHQLLAYRDGALALLLLLIVMFGGPWLDRWDPGRVDRRIEHVEAAREADRSQHRAREARCGWSCIGRHDDGAEDWSWGQD